MNTSDPKRVVQGFFAALISKDLDAVDKLVTDDVAVHYPCVPAGLPKELVGRGPLRDWFAGLLKDLKFLELYDVELHLAEQSGFVFVPCKSRAEFNPNKAYANQYVFVFRVKGDKIAEYWEYCDPEPLKKLFPSS